MSQFLDNLLFFTQEKEPYADGHGELRHESRAWENAYRQRWQHDKIVRSTHGVNCTGSCSWQIYVKNGMVTWETQQTNYPRTRPDLTNHEPHGCPRGASYSWYLYSANRVKHPKVRAPLLRLWREARKTLAPVEAWRSIVEDPEKAASYKQQRGLGGFVRSNWNEVLEIIAAANVYTVKTWGPDRVVGFSPIPAMSMISYASGTRYLSLIGGVCLSFYDWYCDLPPASPQVWGEQTDVPDCRLVQQPLHHRLGLERADDPHPGRALPRRGALQGDESRRRYPGLCRNRQIWRRMAQPAARHRRRICLRDGARRADRVVRQKTKRLFHRLRPPLHRFPDAGHPRRQRQRRPRPRPLPPCL
jgi:nitrate reductase, alpha subunit